jgi:ectoine hydroxylase-related dioxygenase (phytanoyl-CoA dioxygenase family)
MARAATAEAPHPRRACHARPDGQQSVRFSHRPQARPASGVVERGGIMVPSLAAQDERAIGADTLGHLEREGFAVVPNWLDRGEADAIVALMDAWIDANADRVQRKSDDRIFGAEHLAPAIAAHKHDGRLEHIASTYMGREQKALFTLGNRLRATPGKKTRSGGRWHRDRKGRQFKSLVYLTDCVRRNGAFCIVPRSATPDRFVDAIAATRFNFPALRWDDGDIEPFLAKLGDDVVPIEGAAGTLVLFDSSLIHSGLPIRVGHRYALTNYYYAEGEIDLDKMADKFAPAVRPFEMPRFDRPA